MRIDEAIYFAPGIKAVDLDFNNKKLIISAFSKRIKEYYLTPIKKLNKAHHAFGAGVLLMTTIDALTYYSIGGNNRIKDFISMTAAMVGKEEAVKKKIIKGFDDYFRNGLIHEGRIKNCGQFSYDYGWMVNIQDDFIVINPDLLSNEVERYFREFVIKLEEDVNFFSVFINKFKRQYESEITQLKAIYN